MSYHLLRMGEGSKFASEALNDGLIGIGFLDVPDIQKLGTLQKIKKAVEAQTHSHTPMQIANQAGQLYRFGIEMQPEDIVLTPFGDGEYLVGEVGEYYYEEKPPGHCHYKHRRKVHWNKKRLLKDDMSTNLSYALNAALTIFSLNKYSKELEALIAGKTFTPAERPQRVRDIILNNLKELTGKEFEEFIRHLLEIVGFTAETTQYTADKGIDVNGILDAEGMASITLRVQVKRVQSSIGNKHILALRGALSHSEHGCFVTLSNFTSQAQEEAEAPGKTLIKLIDGNDLSALVLKHWEEIGDDYKKILGIRRKKVDLEDQFEAVYELPDKIDKKEAMITEGHCKWDTIVCAAREDGFKNAFLDEKAWWAIRLNPKTIFKIKYIAMYQVAPVSKITYYGKVSKILLYEDTGKYKIYLEGDPKKLDKPVGIGANPHLKPQAPRYTLLEKILVAKNLDDVFG